MTALRTLSDDELLREREHWQTHLQQAHTWSAGVSVSLARIADCDRELRYRSAVAVGEWNESLCVFGPRFGVRQ